MPSHNMIPAVHWIKSALQRARRMLTVAGTDLHPDTPPAAVMAR
ncbi:MULTISPECIES: hypothetical protein [Gordonia]|nr:MULTISPECIES: hypothetical protein [Gordonia]